MHYFDKPNRLRTWIGNWLLGNRNEAVLSSPSISTGIQKSSIELNKSFSFSVTVAQGGIVLSTRRYDRKRDETNETVYVLHDDDNIAQNIGNIVNMEMLRG